MSLEDQLAALLAGVVRDELHRAGLAAPAPYPIGCSIEEAARLLGVGRDKVRALLADGRIRQLDLGGGSRVVISTMSLFELDPACSPAHLADVFSLDRGAA